MTAVWGNNVVVSLLSFAFLRVVWTYSLSVRETYANRDYGRSNTEQQRYYSVANIETPIKHYPPDDCDQCYCRSDKRISAVASLARHGRNTDLNELLVFFVLRRQKPWVRV